MNTNDMPTQTKQLEPYSIRVDRNPYNVPNEDWILLSGPSHDPFLIATCADQSHANLLASAPEALALLEFIHEHIKSGSDWVPIYALIGDDQTTFKNAVLAYFAKVKGGE